MVPGQCGDLKGNASRPCSICLLKSMSLCHNTTKFTTSRVASVVQGCFVRDLYMKSQTNLDSEVERRNKKADD